MTGLSLGAFCLGPFRMGGPLALSKALFVHVARHHVQHCQSGWREMGPNREKDLDSRSRRAMILRLAIAEVGSVLGPEVGSTIDEYWSLDSTVTFLQRILLH